MPAEKPKTATGQAASQSTAFQTSSGALAMVRSMKASSYWDLLLLLEAEC